MTAVLPIESDHPGSTISLRFARSRYFAIINPGTPSLEIIPNPFPDKNAQVGSQVFTLLTGDKEADTFIAFELGLNVQQMASKKGIRLIILKSKTITLGEILQLMNLTSLLNKEQSAAL